MNRLRVRVFSGLIALFAALTAAPVHAEDGLMSPPPPQFWFAGTRLIFAHAVANGDDVAVPVHDPGLARFLARLGATIAYQPQQRYVVVTSADHRTITLTIGSTQYTAGGVTAQAAFAPYVDAGDANVPLYAVAHALYVEPVAGAGETILQPQIGALDIRADGKRTIVTIHAATPVAYIKRVETPTHLELAFSGVSSTLAETRRVGSTNVTIESGGSPKNPTTVITFDSARPAQHDIETPTPYEVALAFGDTAAAVAAPILPAPVVNAPVAAAPYGNAPPPPPPAPSGAAGSPLPLGSGAASAASPAAGTSAAAVVTSVVLVPGPDGLTIRVGVNGTAMYGWHRLNDMRWYLDIANATLTDAGRDEHPATPAVESVRIRQIGSPDAPVVRIALTLRGEKQVDVTSTADGLEIAAGNADDVADVRTGGGTTGGASGTDVADAAGAPLAAASAAPAPFATATPWKFVNGSRIIVLDPGHGGDDMGTAHNGLVEKLLTIDIARRLRALLIAQGWTVRMTRDSDVDPVTSANLAKMNADGKPNPDDRAYLQTRCDVANDVNARMFISIHVNYSDSPSINGTTFYWYKPEDQLLAQTLERAVIPVTGTNDDGPRHENFYVIHHTTMPAVLIETAFISNPHDAALLASPAFLQNMAAGIAAGVKAYAGVPPALSKLDQ
jgi:N-acetylmuramoyl-L-alanine amidase